MMRKVVYLFLALFLIADLSFSFLQYLEQPLDGDIARNLVPEEGVKPVFESPLGFKAIDEDIRYTSPNRYFSHWAYRSALLELPDFYNQFTDPIESVYLACATWKITFQLVLICLLAFIITGSLNILRLDFIIAAVLITPFFQANGYSDYMGIIDASITYSFFYAMPLIVLIIYLLPMFFRWYYQETFLTDWMLALIWIPMVFVVCLSGPLNPAILLILSALLFYTYTFKNQSKTETKSLFSRVINLPHSMPKLYVFLVVPACLLSIYSLYLGSYNSESIISQISLAEMYGRLPEGIYLQFTQKLGFPILFGVLIINVILIKKGADSDTGTKILQLYNWIILFSVIYILLLPLGGYRVYRPHILRYDTIMPITIGLVFLFGLSSVYLINKLSRKQLRYYIPVIVAVLFIFTNSDQLEAGKSDCERSALSYISASPDSVVVLTHDCSVVAWSKFQQPEESHLNGQLLKMWGITHDVKLYVNQ